MSARSALASLLLLVFAPPAPAAAAPPRLDAYLAELAGRWDFSGTLGGKPVRYLGVGRRVLEDGWLRLELTDAGSPPAYQADVYFGFDAKAGDYVAHWLDRFGGGGARVVATGRREGRKLVLLFPYAEGAFRDTLVLAGDGNSGTLLIESQARDGSWSNFASYVFRRLPASAAAPQ